MMYRFEANGDFFVKLGEMRERIFNVGCPSIDAIINTEDDPKILKKFNLKENEYFILLQHPVTSEMENSKEQITTSMKTCKGDFRFTVRL